MSWASLWRPPIQIRPVSHQAGPKINDKRGKDKWECLTISCKVLHMNCLSKYPEAQKQRHMFLNGHGWSPLQKNKNHKDNTLLLCSFSFSVLICAFVLCAWNSPVPQKSPRSIIPGESDPLTFPFLSLKVAWLSQEVSYLESTIFGFSAASLTNNSGTTGKGCHKTWIRWYQNKSCINRTRSTIT